MASNHFFKPVTKKKQPVPHVKPHPLIYAIFFKRYRIRMTAKDVRSIEQMRARPTYSSGDTKLDKSILNTETIVYSTINEMVEFYREGVSFFLTQAEDSRTIYEAVTDHTGYWRETMMKALNVRNAPIEDLILMERFAASIYKHARFQYEKKELAYTVGGTLAEFLFSKPTIMPTTTINGELQKVGDQFSDRKVEDLLHTPDIDVFRRAIAITQENDDYVHRS